MTNREKRFLTYDNQITLLKRQGMIVSDENAARDILEQIGFYELVNGYKAIFKRDGHGNYLPGTTFEELYALYKCDENLRQLFLKYMLRVEIHMRSLLSYAFCERFGHEQSAYLTRESYDTEGPAADEINRLIGELDYAANRADKAVYVCHHRKRYPTRVTLTCLRASTRASPFSAASVSRRDSTFPYTLLTTKRAQRK